MDKKLLSILACPRCKGNLVYLANQQELICKADKMAFPIKEDIPILIEEAARPVEADETF